MSNKGAEYERFVARLYETLLASDEHFSQKNINIELNKKIEDRYEVKREFDIYWEYKLMRHVYKTVIECKDYNRPISMEKIDAFQAKIDSIPTSLKGIFATRKGYQSGVLERLPDDTIDLLIVREQNDSDWEDSEGNPFMKPILLEMTLILPAKIIDIKPNFDAEWMQKHHQVHLGDTYTVSGLSNEIFIEDDDKKTKVSLYDLAHTLKPPSGETKGVFVKQLDLTSGWLSSPDQRLKINGITIEYETFEPSLQTLNFDYAEMLVGVIEYLSNRTKKLVFQDGAGPKTLSTNKS